MLPFTCPIRLSCYLCVNKGWTATNRFMTLRLFSPQQGLAGQAFPCQGPLRGCPGDTVWLGLPSSSSRFGG